MHQVSSNLGIVILKVLWGLDARTTDVSVPKYAYYEHLSSEFDIFFIIVHRYLGIFFSNVVNRE